MTETYLLLTYFSPMNKKIICLALSAFFGVAHAESVFITLEKDNALAIVNPVDGTLIKTVPIGKRPRGIAFSSDFKQLYVATSDDNTIKVFDAQTLKETGRLPSGKDPETFALSPTGDKMYVSNEDDSLVTVIDLAKKKVIKQIKVGVEPEGITVSPDNKWLISASETKKLWITRWLIHGHVL
jgi:YVTN family beta-propeller protein